MEILKGFFDNLQSDHVYLNRTQIKSIQVCIDPEKLPNITPVFKLNDLTHKCHITFSKESMNAITQKSGEIKRCLRDEEERMFLLNDELKVFSERMHNSCAVCFLNFQGVRMNLMIDTFRQMMDASVSTFSKHRQIEENMQKSAKNLKQLFDALLAKFDECNVNNPEYQSFLQRLQQYVNSLSHEAPVSSNATNESNVVDITNDDDDDDDVDEDADEDEEMDEDGYDEYDDDDDEDHYIEFPFGHRRRGYQFW